MTNLQQFAKLKVLKTLPMCIILKETKQRDMVFADKLSLLQLQNIC